MADAKRANTDKVLVYLFGSLGDNIASIPALRAIRRHFGDAEIVVLENHRADMPANGSDVLPPELVDRYLQYAGDGSPLARLTEFGRLWLKLRSEKFDAAVYLAISDRPARSVDRDQAFFRSCGIGHLYGFHAFSPGELYPRNGNGRPARVPHEAKRRTERLERDGIDVNDSDFALPLITPSADDVQATKAWLAERGFDTSRPITAIAPGCKTISNLWPEERFAEIGRRLHNDLAHQLVVVGGCAEIEIGDRLVQSWGYGINSSGAFSIRGSAALLSLCGLYIGLDTGATHLAAAVGTPVFSLYGERNNPGQWFPEGDRYAVIYHETDCAGCRNEVCPVAEHPCLTGIDTESAWRELLRFINHIGEDRSKALPLIVKV